MFEGSLLEPRGDPGHALLEHGRGAGSFREEIQKLGRIDAERPTHRELLAQRLPIDHQRQIDRELEHRARADRTGMQRAPAHLIDDRPGARDVGRFAAHQAEQLAGPRRRDRAADRTFDIGRALGLDLLGERRPGPPAAPVLISMNSLPFTSPASRPCGP